MLELTFTARTGREHVVYLRRHLLKALEHVPDHPREISVALVGDARMSELHERFQGIAGPTDVLTFELDHDTKGRVIAGEIVVCVPEARRRAKELDHPVRLELLLYVLHGVLHLSGYDDRTDAGYRRMHRAEDRILTRIGVGSVFDRPAHKREA